MGLESDSDIATIPAPKRSFFKKSAWAKPAEEDEALELFSRSKEIFPDVVAENERQLKKFGRTRSNESVERVDGKVDEGKRRRISNEFEDSEGSLSEDVTIQDRRTSKATPPRASSTRPGSNSPQHKRRPSLSTINHKGNNNRDSPRKSQKPQLVAIDLSDSEEETTDAVIKDSKGQLISLDFDDGEEEEALKIPRTVIPATESVPEEEEFPELVAKAREGARRKMFERPDPIKSNTRPETLLKEGVLSNSEKVDVVRLARPAPPAPDPVVQILVTSRIEGTRPLILKRKLSQRLKDVRLGWCDRQVLDGQPVPESTKRQIFLTWRGNKVFDVTTCKAMGLRVDARGGLRVDGDGFDSEGRIHLEAWTDEIFEEYKKLKADQRKRRVLDPMEEEVESELEEQAPAEEVSRLKIVLKSKGYEEFKLLTSAGTQISKMIAAFRNQNNISSSVDISLWLDGEKLAPESLVGDADLDDLTTIDVHISS